MRPPAGAVFAVLTGDLVRSQAMAPAEFDDARARLEAAGTEIADWQPGLVVGGLEFFRGDGWQLCLTRPHRFLRAALLLRARLRAGGNGRETRIGIGLGAAERLDPPRISRSTGAAFTRSGSALDAMPAGARMALLLPQERLQPAAPLLLAAAVALADERATLWKKGQAAALAAALAPAGATQQAIAQRLGISQQTVGTALAGAGWPALVTALVCIETAPVAGWLGGEEVADAE